VTVTNDGATILSLLDIEHPAGKILVDLAQQQDKEVWSIARANFLS
jgi:T-complex protein 1 subunit alpha